MDKIQVLDPKALQELFRTPQKVVITTHRSPDGDAVGSSLALNGILEKQGHDVQVIIPDAAPAFLSWMKGSEDILDFEQTPEDGKRAIEEASVIFSLDYNRLDRIAAVGEHVKSSKAMKIMIDHHIDPSPDFDHILSDTSASSTCELIYRFADQMGWLELLDKDIAEALYAGIMTDTGSFKFSSTSATTHRIAAHLMELGLVPDRVHSAIFDTSSFDRLQLLGYALSRKLEFDPVKGVSIIALSLSEKNRFHYQKGDTEGLVNYGLSIQGARMAIFLSEELNMTKCSFRSKGDLDVNVIARTWFNGGGHKNAAGGRLDMKLKPAINYLKDVIENKLDA